MEKKHCLQPKVLSVMLSVIMMLVGCGGNTPSASSPNDKDPISPTSGTGLSVSSEESRTPDRLAVEPVEETATSFADIQAANAALRASPTEQHEKLQLPFLTEGAPPIAIPLAPRSPDVERVSAEPVSPLLQNIRTLLEEKPNGCYHKIEDENLERLVYRLMHRFELNADKIPFVVRALNRLYHDDLERYVILSDVYGDTAEEHHRRYDHVSSLFDIFARGAMATESWRDRLHPHRLSEALWVLGQAISLQKSVEQGQDRDAQNLVDFSEVCEKFVSYFNEQKNIPIDLKRVKLGLSGNSASLSVPLAPRILHSDELVRADWNMTREDRDDYFSNYANALADAAREDLLKDGEYMDIVNYIQKNFPR